MSETTTVVSSCLVKIPTNHHHRPPENLARPSRIHLTPWDLQLIQLGPIHKGLLFQDTFPQDSYASLVDHLRRSLSQALAFFPPLAGRLLATEANQGGGGAVSYSIGSNNEGVEFVHATAKNTSVSDILEPNYIPRETVASFFPLGGDSYRNCDGDKKPLLGAQVTELKDGVFIGCAANHSVVDGTSFWHFFNSWAEMSRGLDRPKILPVFDRWFPSNMPEDRIYPLPNFGQLTAAVVEQQPPAIPPPLLLEKVFHFNKECLAKLKSKANEEAGTVKISPFQSLAAHLWRSVERCRRKIDSAEIIKDEEIQMMILVSARPRIPLPAGYFGNTVHVAKTSITAGELFHSDLGGVALKISDLVGRQTREATVKVVEDWVDSPAVYKISNLNVFMMTSSPRHNVYGCDFGWGKPLAVRSGTAHKFDGKMTLFPSAAEGGIDVEACLFEETMKALENDEEFIEALFA